MSGLASCTTAVAGTVSVNFCVSFFKVRFIGNARSCVTVRVSVVSVALITVPVKSRENGVPVLA